MSRYVSPLLAVIGNNGSSGLTKRLLLPYTNLFGPILCTASVHLSLTAPCLLFADCEANPPFKQKDLHKAMESIGCSAERDKAARTSPYFLCKTLDGFESQLLYLHQKLI